MEKLKIIKRIMPLIGIALFVYLLLKFDIKDVINIIYNSKIKYVLLSFLFTIILLISQTFKWFIIAKNQKINIPFWKAFKINLISNFYGFVTPSKLGSVIRADYMKKYTGNYGKGFSNFVLDKVFDLTSLFCLAILFLIMFNVVHVSIFIPLILFLIFIGGFLIFYKKERAKFLLRWFYQKFMPQSLKERSKDFFNAFYEDMPKKRYLLVAFICNLINWIGVYTTIYFSGRAVGIDLGITYFLVILPVATIIAQIPITVNGLGTREATMIFLFGKFGVEAVNVLSMSILNILISGILPSIIAIILLMFNLDKD
jgi:hypothetical protein